MKKTTNSHLDELFYQRLKDVKIADGLNLFELIASLKNHHSSINKKGITLFFTGLSGSGKSTVANALLIKLSTMNTAKIISLDGDIIRLNFCGELGFSKKHRHLNISRIGWIASQISQHNGIAICALIAPYKQARRAVRKMVEDTDSVFLEIYLSTSLAVCEQRDSKGLYQLARADKIKHFTGVSDPYEIPISPNITIDTNQKSVDESVNIIINYLKNNDYLQC